MDTLTNEPKVTVIMPAFNMQLYIDEAIRSVLGQTYKNWELIIINDGSTDGTEDIARKYLSDPRIVYIKQENKGLSAARNIGIRTSSGELIAFLDSDDFWLDNKLELQVRYFVKHPKAAILHSACSILRANKLYTPLKYVTFFSWRLKGFIYKKLLDENIISVLTVILRKEILSDVGLFDEKLWGGEDWDLWLRISRKYKIGFINKILAVYRYNSSGMTKNLEKFERAIREVIEKHMLGKKALSNLYTDIGGVYFFKGLFAKSKAYSLIGMKHCLFNYKPYQLYFRSFLRENCGGDI